MNAVDASPSEVERGSGATAVRISNLSKRYGPTTALEAIDLEIEAGTVHALIGENGAGKSTLLGSIAGRVAPSEGEVEIFDERLRLGDLRAARELGVASIYQELTTIPTLNAEANVFLGQFPARGGFISHRQMRGAYEALCEELGVAAVSRGASAGSLSIADQQMLEIMRAIVAKHRVMLFDEPTAPLAQPQRETLYELIGSLRSQGITIVFVSHNLGEVRHLADRITVFRDGHLIVTGERDEFSQDELVGRMLGEARHAAARSSATVTRRSRPESGARTLLSARGLAVPGHIEAIDLEIRAGEVLGVAGLVGSGRTTLLRALAGAEPRARGELEVEGKRLRWPRTVNASRKLGIALIPEDRKEQGLVMPMSAADNVAMGNLGAAVVGGLISRRKLTAQAVAATVALGFPTKRMQERASNFSGGNQQKLLMARWRYSQPRILLADEPTRGIDVGAKAELLEALKAMADDGLAVVVVSSELEEVSAISDRIVVLARGQLVAEFERTDEPIPTLPILKAAFSTTKEER